MINAPITDEQMCTLQLIQSEVLAKAVKGEIDLNQLAKVILAQRGHDENGKWVGFKEAARIHNVTI